MRRFSLALLTIFILFLGNAVFGEQILSSHKEGSYPKDIKLYLSSEYETGRLFYRFSDTRKDQLIPYIIPLELSALPGEKRTYGIIASVLDGSSVLAETEFTYIINKKLPPIPTISVPPGEYERELSLGFTNAPGDFKILYSINSPVGEEGAPWLGKAIRLPREMGKTTSYTVSAYATDDAGNSSISKSWTYTLKSPALRQFQDLIVHSPIEGDFANSQFLVVENSGMEWIKYTLNGQDPAQSGIGYKGPVDLPATGAVRLRIAAKSSNSESILRKEIRYSVTPVSHIKTTLKNGIITSPLQVVLDADSDIFYTFGDKDPGQYGLLYESSFEVKPLPGSPKLAVLRFHAYSKLTSRLNEHRYVFLLDDRIPEPPKIVVDKPGPGTSSWVISILSQQGSSVRYTLDNTAPNADSPEYREPLDFKVLRSAITVRAKAFFPNGKASREVGRTINPERTSPQPPKVGTEKRRNDLSVVTLTIKTEKKNRLYYEVAYNGSLPANPTLRSAVCPETMNLDVPFGMERQFHFKFAAADDQGNLSTPTDLKVSLDRLPPAPPELSIENGFLRIEGDGSIYYTLTGVDSPPIVPDASANLYKGPVPIPGVEDTLTSYTLYAVAIDPIGNASDISGPLYAEVDLRQPYVPALIGISDGSLLNIPVVNLRFVDGQPNTDIYYTVTTDGTDPPNPTLGSSKFEKSLSLEGLENRDTLVKCAFLPVNRKGGLFGEIKRLSFTIDRSIPKPPKLNFADNLLSITGEGDIYYTVSESDDPVASETEPLIYQAPIPLPGIEGERIVYTVSALSLDASGNLSSITGPVEFPVDRRIPELPLIGGAENGGSYNSETVRLFLQNDDPEVRVYYTYTLDGKSPPIPDISSAFMEEDISFSGVLGREVHCRIKFMPYNLESRREGIVSQISFLIDMKPPAVPVLRNGAARRVVNEEFFPTILTDGETAQIFVGFAAEGFEVPNPFGKEGILVNEYFSLDAPWGEERSFVFQLGSVDRAGNKTLNKQRYGITIDKKLPELPEVSGVTSGSLYNHGLIAELTASDPGDKILFALSGSPLDTVDLIGSRLQPYSGGIRLDVGDGEERTIYLYTAAKDNAGNISINDEPVIFTLDKKRPQRPRFSGIPLKGISSTPVMVAVDAGNAAVYYEIGSEGSFPVMPSVTSQQYTVPIELKGEEGKEITYHVAAVSADQAANISGHPETVSVTIDRKGPDELRPPQIDTSLIRRNIIEVSWGPGEDTIFYKINRSLDDTNPLVPYIKPFFIPLSEVEGAFSLSYYASDEAGNRTETREIRFPAPLAASGLLEGVENNRVYRDSLTIYKTFTDGVIRYTLSPYSEGYRRVDQFSPILEDRLNIQALPGETVEYTFQAALFESMEAGHSIYEEAFRFVLDRNPPPVPEIVGVGNEAYFKDDLVIEVKAPEGSPYYQLVNTTAGDRALEEAEFLLYREPVRVQAEKGEFASYRLTAYTVDDAGNESRRVSTSFFIDREIIYVSSEGSDNYTGSRERPFKTIKKALDYAADTGRKTLFLDEGEHVIDTEISIERDVTIVGGFEPITWKRDHPGTTLLVPGKNIRDSNALFAITAGNLIVRNISIEDSGTKMDGLFHLGSGELHLTETVLSLNRAKQEKAVVQKGGTLTINNSLITISGNGSITALVSSGGVLEITDSVIECSGLGDAVLVEGTDNDLIRIAECEFNPGAGGTTTALAFTRSKVEITDSLIMTGGGKRNSLGIVLASSAMAAENIEIKGNRSSRIATLLSADDSTLDIGTSRFFGSGDQGGIALLIKNSQLTLSRSYLEAEPTGEFFYYFKTTNTSGLVSNNYVVGGVSGDLVYAENTRSKLKWFNNTFLDGTGQRRTSGFRFLDDAGSQFINNIIMAGSGRDRVAFFIQPGSALPSLRFNNCAGWDSLVQQGSRTVTSVAELNRFDNEPARGPISDNISEDKLKTFIVTKDGLFRINQSSQCVDNGLDVKQLGGEAFDWEGDSRPNTVAGSVPRYDIGADEFYSLPQTR